MLIPAEVLEDESVSRVSPLYGCIRNTLILSDEGVFVARPRKLAGDGQEPDEEPHVRVGAADRNDVRQRRSEQWKPPLRLIEASYGPRPPGQRRPLQSDTS